VGAMDNNKELFEILDTQSKVMVGVLMRRIEILEQENSLSPSLLKQLIKDTTYEHFRAIKTMLTIGKVIFVSKKQE
jgi:hypothetical protein